MGKINLSPVDRLGNADRPKHSGWMSANRAGRTPSPGDVCPRGSPSTLDPDERRPGLTPGFRNDDNDDGDDDGDSFESCATLPWSPIRTIRLRRQRRSADGLSGKLLNFDNLCSPTSGRQITVKGNKQIQNVKKKED